MNSEQIKMYLDLKKELKYSYSKLLNRIDSDIDIVLKMDELSMPLKEKIISEFVSFYSMVFKRKIEIQVIDDYISDLFIMKNTKIKRII